MATELIEFEYYWITVKGDDEPRAEIAMTMCNTFGVWAFFIIAQEGYYSFDQIEVIRKVNDIRPSVNVIPFRHTKS